EKATRERRSHLVARRENRQNNGSRAERKHEAEEKAETKRDAGHRRDADRGERRQNHLQRSGEKCRAAENFEFSQRNMQADEEEDKRDPELRDRLDARRITDQSESMRPDHRPRHEVAQNLRQADALSDEEQRKGRN